MLCHFAVEFDLCVCVLKTKCVLACKELSTKALVFLWFRKQATTTTTTMTNIKGKRRRKSLFAVVVYQFYHYIIITTNSHLEKLIMGICRARACVWVALHRRHSTIVCLRSRIYVHLNVVWACVCMYVPHYNIMYNEMKCYRFGLKTFIFSAMAKKGTTTMLGHAE